MPSHPAAAVSAPPRVTPLLAAFALSLLLGLQPISTDVYLPALPMLTAALGAPMSSAQLTMSARGSWRVELDKGAALELGRGTEDEVLARTDHFVHTVPRVVAQYQRPLESADLRHADGFAVRLKGVVTNVPAVAARKR